jgi:hypothetical protein
MITQVNSSEEIPQFWKEGRKKNNAIRYSAIGGWDIQSVTYERDLSPTELRVNYIGGSIAFTATLGNFRGWGSEITKHLLHNTTETKTFYIILKGWKQGQSIPVSETE